MSYCPWCHANVKTGRAHGKQKKRGRAVAVSYAAHVQACPDAPEAVKAAYKVPYP